MCNWLFNKVFNKLFNKPWQVVSAIPDQDTFYDVTDALEELGMDTITQRQMNKQGADLDLLTQFQIYEVGTILMFSFCKLL